MRVAFYAPLKPPDHPVPSGDRRMARLLLAALRQVGHRVELMSRLRAYDGAGDRARQERIRAQGDAIAARLIARLLAAPEDRRPEAWLTYHPYYKAPDWLGLAVAAALDIPYLVAEASHAPKRSEGPWAIGHAASAAGVMAADCVLCLNPADVACLLPLVRDRSRVIQLAPFLDPEPYRRVTRGAARSELAARLGLDAGPPWLLAVGMMREGDKLRSYRILGDALARLLERDWRLIVVGGGKAEAAVTAALAPLGSRVARLGALAPDALAPVYAAADMLAWPAINEAYGMALLEAQASGLPVVAGASGGVAAIVEDGHTGLLTPPGEVAAFAAATARLLDDANLRAAMGAAARRRVALQHGITAAARQLDAALSASVASYGRRAGAAVARPAG